MIQVIMTLKKYHHLILKDFKKKENYISIAINKFTIFTNIINLIKYLLDQIRPF